MVFKLIVLDTIRRTPSKFLIIFFAFVIVGSFSPRFKVLKAYKEFNFKEVEKRRAVVFEMAVKMNDSVKI